jgi:hypothetical protein
MNFINLKLLLFLLQLLLIVVLESTPLIRNKECYKRLLPKSIIIGVKKSGKYIFYSVSYCKPSHSKLYNNFMRGPDILT